MSRARAGRGSFPLFATIVGGETSWATSGGHASFSSAFLARGRVRSDTRSHGPRRRAMVRSRASAKPVRRRRRRAFRDGCLKKRSSRKSAKYESVGSAPGSLGGDALARHHGAGGERHHGGVRGHCCEREVCSVCVRVEVGRSGRHLLDCYQRNKKRRNEIFRAVSRETRQSSMDQAVKCHCRRFRSAKSIALSRFRARAPPVPEMASPEEAASGAEPFDARELQGRIDAVLEREHASWGVLVYSTGLGRDIAAHRPDTALVPASNVKLFTALASLLVSHVGPTRALRTAAHVVDVPGDGTRASSGDAGSEPRRRRAVCVHPCGDPGFTAEQLAELVGGALEAAGVSADDVDPGRTRLGVTRGATMACPRGRWGRASDWAAPPSRAVLDRNVEFVEAFGNQHSTRDGAGPNAARAVPGRVPRRRARRADCHRDGRGFRQKSRSATGDGDSVRPRAAGVASPAFRVGVASPLFEISARGGSVPGRVGDSRLGARLGHRARRAARQRQPVRGAARARLRGRARLRTLAHVLERGVLPEALRRNRGSELRGGERRGERPMARASPRPRARALRGRLGPLPAQPRAPSRVRGAVPVGARGRRARGRRGRGVSDAERRTDRWRGTRSARLDALPETARDGVERRSFGNSGRDDGRCSRRPSDSRVTARWARVSAICAAWSGRRPGRCAARRRSAGTSRRTRARGSAPSRSASSRTTTPRRRRTPRTGCATRWTKSCGS